MLSPFKIFGAVVCLAFALCFAAPNANADSFTYTFTGAGFSAGTFFTLASTGELTFSSTNLANLITGSSNYETNGTSKGTVQFVEFTSPNSIGVGNGGEIGGVWAFSTPYALTPGTYTDLAGSTLVVTAVATPEPSSLALMLSGVGLVFGMRKRWGLSLAS